MKNSPNTILTLNWLLVPLTRRLSSRLPRKLRRLPPNALGFLPPLTNNTSYNKPTTNQALPKVAFHKKPIHRPSADDVAPSDFRPGRKVILNSTKQLGIIKYVGKVHSQPNRGEFVGIHLLQGGGKNDGFVKGVKYFETQKGHGLFVKPSAVQLYVGK